MYKPETYHQYPIDIMPIVIKEIHVRTVVERRIVTETDITEEIIRKIEGRVVERLSAHEDGLPGTRRPARKKNDR